MRKEEAQEALNRSLSGLQEDPWLVQRIIAKEEEKPMKKKLSTSVILVASILCICAAALAAGIYGLDWYWNKDNGWEKQSNPEKYEEISAHLTQPADQGEWPDELMTAVVQDVAWVQDQNLLSMSLKASLKDEVSQNGNGRELHPRINVDTDGAWLPDDDEQTDEEQHYEHYLWTDKGHGKISMYMDQSDNDLILVDLKEIRIFGIECPFSYDVIRMENECYFYVECHLDWLDATWESTLQKNGAPDGESFDQIVAAANRARESLSKSEGWAEVGVIYETTHYDPETDTLYQNARVNLDENAIVNLDLHSVQMTLKTE